MSTTIDEIKNKYKVSFEEASIIYSAVNREGMPIHVVMSIFNTLPKGGNIGLKLKNAIHAYQTTQISVSRPIGTKDDKSTKFLKTDFDIHGNIALDDKGRRLPHQPSRSISTRRMLTVDDYKETHPSPRDIPPKYYYFDLDLKFNGRGHETSPQYDTQFHGFYHHVPYARVTADKVISPSHYPVPITDEAGNIIGREKTRGSRLLNVDLFFEGDTDRIQIRAPYESRSEYDMIQGLEVVNRVRSILSNFMSDRVKKIYQIIKDDKNTDTILTQLDRKYDVGSKIESDKKLKEYYGEFEERKRKSSKTSPKRKTIAKKTVTRKCVCKPTVHKRRVMAVKKKLTIRRKRK
jgi:hypothetical protein